MVNNSKSGLNKESIITGNEKVYFSHDMCGKCANTDDDDYICKNCIRDMSESWYRDFRKIAPKADKVVIIANNSNWQGRTGYMVVNLDANILNTILCKTTNYNLKVFKKGRNMFIMGYSHDVPTGGLWQLKPVCSNGLSSRYLITKVLNKIKK